MNDLSPRRYLISRGFGNQFVYAHSPAELADVLSDSGRMLDEHARKAAHQAWDSGIGEYGLVTVERREPA